MCINFKGVLNPKTTFLYTVWLQLFLSRSFHMGYISSVMLFAKKKRMPTDSVYIRLHINFQFGSVFNSFFFICWMKISKGDKSINKCFLDVNGLFTLVQIHLKGKERRLIQLKKNAHEQEVIEANLYPKTQT